MADNNEYDLPIDIPEDESSYKLLLDEANSTDLSEFERCQCVSIRYQTNDCPIIIFLPKLAMLTEKKYDKIIMKKVLLLFIKKANEIISSDYIIVYGHTPLNILSQQSVIYKYYKILPRPYKKNIKKLIIIHPQLGIKMLFEFSKVFLSSKFYSKLILLDSIYDLQCLISPSILLLPFKFIKYEDDEKDLKYVGNNIPSLRDTYFQSLGTTKLLADCISFLRNNSGFDRVGIFRIPGDENILKLAKIRMQRMFSTNSIPIVHDKIIIGVQEINQISLPISKSESSETTTIESGSDITPYPIKSSVKSKSPRRGTTLASVFSSAPTISTPSNRHSTGIGLVTTTPTTEPNSSKSSSYPSLTPSSNSKNNISTVVFTDIDSIAQILKFSLRELPEPIITYDCYDTLLLCTKRWKSNDSKYNKDDWEIDVQRNIDSLPEEHKSTLNNLLYFLAEVASFSSVNNMDASNLATVFAPTLMRSRDADNAAKFLSEVGLSSIILLHLIENASTIVATQNRLRSISNVSIASSGDGNNAIFHRNPVNSNRTSIVTIQSDQLKYNVNDLLESDKINVNDISISMQNTSITNTNLNTTAVDEIQIQSGLSAAMLERFGRGRRNTNR